MLLASGLASRTAGRPLAEDDPSPHHGPGSVRGGAYLGLPTVSVPPQDAQAHFGWIGHFFGMDATASAYAGANIALAA